MSCTPIPEFETITTTTTGALTTFTTQSESSDVVSGAFPSSLCAESANGQCIRSTLATLSFTYTTVATLPITVTTNPILTTTETITTGTQYTGCSNPPSNGSNDSSNNSSNNNHLGAIVGGAVGGGIALIILLGLLLFLWRRNRKMQRQLKEVQEEERRQDMVNIADTVPSPFIQHPPPVSGTLAFNNTPPSSDGRSPPPPPSSYAGRTADAANTAYSGVEWSPAHSRQGSLPASSSVIGESLLGGTIEPFNSTPSPSSQPPGSSSSALLSEPAGSAKAREAYAHRRSPLAAQNLTENDDPDFIGPSTTERPNLQPSTTAWDAPPAYSPGERPNPAP